MIQVIDNEITQYSLPKTDYLKNGESVSGYDKLDDKTLKSEGWLTLEDNPPEYDEETHYLQQDGYDILKTKVKKKYKIVKIPEEEPSELDLLREETKELRLLVEELTK